MSSVSPQHSRDLRNVAVQVLALCDRKGEWTDHTLQLLGDASRLTKSLRGDLGVWVLASPPISDRNKPASPLAELAARGCRIAHRLISERFRNWASEAVAAAIAPHVLPRCRAIFLPGSSRGEEVAALLATMLQTEWIPDVLNCSVTRTGTVEITAVEPGGKLSRSYRVAAGGPVVVTMREGVAEAQPSAMIDDVDVVDIDVALMDVPHPTRIEQHLPADPGAIDITFAQRIVAGGKGTGGPDGMRELANLAKTLRASLAASRMVVDLGWAPQELQVGQTGKTVRPDLYVACGISGASHHLAGMRDSSHIVAINSDVNAPIHEVSHLSLYGDLHEVVPAIEAAIARRRRSHAERAEVELPDGPDLNG